MERKFKRVDEATLQIPSAEFVNEVSGGYLLKAYFYGTNELVHALHRGEPYSEEMSRNIDDIDAILYAIEEGGESGDGDNYEELFELPGGISNDFLTILWFISVENPGCWNAIFCRDTEIDWDELKENAHTTAKLMVEHKEEEEYDY